MFNPVYTSHKINHQARPLRRAFLFVKYIYVGTLYGDNYSFLFIHIVLLMESLL